MKTHLILATAIALSLFSIKSFAQQNELKPGIYSVVDSVYTPLSYVCANPRASFGAGSKVGNFSVGGELVRSDLHYKGVTSGVVATNKIVLVIDPEKKTGWVTPKRFDAFTKRLSPEDMIIIPLLTNHKKDRREYEQGTIISVILDQVEPECAHFEWKKTSENTFEITLFDLIPGEYGVVFRLTDISPYSYANIFGFTIK